MPATYSRPPYTVSGERASAARAAPIGGTRWPHRAQRGRRARCAYFEFGDRDAFSIVDLPDDEAAAAVALIANASEGDGEDDRAAHTRTGRRGGEPRGHLPSAGTLGAAEQPDLWLRRTSSKPWSVHNLGPPSPDLGSLAPARCWYMNLFLLTLS